jgi:hypothetical protein
VTLLPKGELSRIHKPLSGRIDRPPLRGLPSRVAEIRLAYARLHKSVPSRGLMASQFLPRSNPFGVLLTRYLGFGTSKPLRLFHGGSAVHVRHPLFQLILFRQPRMNENSALLVINNGMADPLLAFIQQRH